MAAMTIGVTGIGVDIVSVSRIENSLLRFKQRFIERLLAPSERQDYVKSQHSARFMAKRFAAKEAAAKALGTGIRQGVSLHDFTIHHHPLGKPLLKIVGIAAQKCQAQGINRYHLSLSDEGDSVIAFVVMERQT